MLEKPPKIAPHYRKVPNTNYIVDCFGIDCKGLIFFLSHFHADHYGGLNKKFDSIIYCSKTTANLAKRIAKKEFIYSLDLYKWYQIEKNNFVLLLDANHCPGAVSFVFCINGLFHFHTGDFRCSDMFYRQFENLKIVEDIFELPLHQNSVSFQSNNILENDKIKNKLPMENILQIEYDNLYIDNTYEGYRLFDTQENTIHRILDIIENKLYDGSVLVPVNYCLMFATYSVGKEKIFLSVAEYFDFDIYVNKYKMDLIKCIDDNEIWKIDSEVKAIVKSYKDKKETDRKKFKYNITLRHDINDRYPISNDFFDKDNAETQTNTRLNCFDRFTLDETKNCIHITSMMFLNKNKIEGIVRKLKHDKVLIFAGTGWKDMARQFLWNKEDGRKIKNGIEIIYVPYSEHSSNSELDNFKEKLQYKYVINTVKNKY